jgi:hypothetical protein
LKRHENMKMGGKKHHCVDTSQEGSSSQEPGHRKSVANSKENVLQWSADYTQRNEDISFNPYEIASMMSHDQTIAAVQALSEAQSQSYYQGQLADYQDRMISVDTIAATAMVGYEQRYHPNDESIDWK